MICLLLTTLIWISFYLLVSACVTGTGLSQKILLTFLFTSAQIIATELLLGLAGSLYASALAVVNCLLAAMALCYSLRKSDIKVSEIIRSDFGGMKASLFRLLNCHNVLLFMLIVPAYAWILLAAYHLPLRGVDDLFYHLPPVFHYIQTHTISLLPVEIRHHFAYPQNAELLYLWPTIFSRNVRLLDSANVPFVLISVILVRELLRLTFLADRDVLFVAMLYALCPVVLMQAGSNYIDIIVALFYLLSLYYTLKYEKEQRTIHAVAAGVATGIVCGMKYTALFLTIPLQLLLLWKMFKVCRRHALHYFLPLLLLSGWWYARNTFKLGNPFYPMKFSSGMGFMAGGENSSLATDLLENIRHWLQAFPLNDLGLGSYDGGFGLVFWGLAFPSWLILLVISLARPRFLTLSRITMLLQLPLGFLMLLAIPKNELVFSGRMALFVVAIGLFSLGAVMSMVNSNLCNSAVKSVCILFSLLAVCLMSTSTMPFFRLEGVFADRRAGLDPSEYKYVQDANSVYAILRYIWEPLDYLSRDSATGFNCYLAADRSLVALAPLYGSRLQNSLVNIGEISGREPDALVYLARPDRYRDGKFIKKEIRYYGYELKLEEMLAGNELVAVTQTGFGCLLLRRSLLQQPENLKLLQKYYRETWPEEVAAAQELKRTLTNNAPLLTSSSLAYGLRCLYDDDDIMDKIVLVPEGFEEHVAVRRAVNRCYTLEIPLRGYASFPVAVLTLHGRQLTLYFNHAREPADA